MPVQSWISAGAGNEVLLDQLPDEPEIAGVENLELRFDAEVAQDGGAAAQIVGRGDVGAVAVAEVEAAAVERGDVGAVESLLAQLDDVAHALLLADEVGARGGSILEPVLADADVAAHAAGEVDDDIDAAFADALDDLAIVAGGHAEGPRLRIAHVNVDDGGAGARRRECRIGDLRRADGAVGIAGDLGIIPGDRTRDDDVGIHMPARARFDIMSVIIK